MTSAEIDMGVPPPEPMIWPRSTSKTGLGTALLRVIVCTLLVLIVFAIYAQVRVPTAKRSGLDEQVLALAQIAAERQNRMFAGVRQMALSFAELAEVRTGNVAACNARIASLQKISQATVISVIGSDGMVFCSSDPQWLGLNVSQRDDVQAALAGSQPVKVGIDRSQGGALTADFVYPIRSPVAAALDIRYDLAALSKLLPAKALSDDAVAFLVDREGVVLARDPISSGGIGSVFPNPDMVAQLKQDRIGLALDAGFDGRRRIYGFMALADVPDLIALVGLPEQPPAEWRDSWWKFGLLGSALTAFGLIGWLLGWPRSSGQDHLRDSGLDDVGEPAIGDGLRQTSSGSDSSVDASAVGQSAMVPASPLQSQDPLGEIASGLAHEFNNHLAAVLSNLNALKKIIRHESMADRLLDGAIQAAERGAALMRQLVAYARREDLHRTAVDVPALVQGLQPLLHRAAGPLIRLGFEVPEHVPLAHVDPDQLELALINLVRNARNAMPFGGAVSVALSLEVFPSDMKEPLLDAGRYARLDVADTSTGRDPATLEQAVRSARGEGQGSGLDLSLVYDLAARSGGGLRLTSAPGGGTTISLWLPCADPEIGERGGQAPGHLAVSHPCTVLLVDDDLLVAMGTEAMLKSSGHSVLLASSGPRALEIMRASGKIDLVITDYAMPGMTGVELAAAIKTAWPTLPVLLSTGYDELPSGIDSSLPRLLKPFREEELAQAMAELVGGVANVVPLWARSSATSKD